MTPDPLQLLRDSADVAPPAGAAARVFAKLSSGVVPLAAPPPLAAPNWKTLGERFVRWSLVPLGLGIAIGAGGHAWSERRRTESRAPQLMAAASVSRSEPAPPLPVVEPAVEPPSVASARVVSSAIARSSLVDERLLLDRARRQLASDEPARALSFLEQHAQRFARGQLAEEREAMWVNVLVQLDRKAEAKARGAAFQARFPNSLMGASVRAALSAADALP